MSAAVKSENWQGKTDGLPWMQRSLLFFTQGIGLYVFYGLTFVVTLFYLITNRREYNATKNFYMRVFGMSSLKAVIYTHRNFYTLGKIVMDRFSAYGGRQFKIDIENPEQYEEMENGNEGFVQLSSHVGNYEMAGYMKPFKKKKLNVLVYSGETETVMENRKRIFEANNIKMILSDGSMDHIYSINNALERGEIVGIPADRIHGSAKSIKSPFFDGNIALPMGPFLVAAQRDLPVTIPFVIKKSATRYSIYTHIFRLSGEQKEKPLREKAAIIAAYYAKRLEEVVREYPLQWFNYFDVFAP